MKYFSRRMIKHEDLNHMSRLFGGTVLSWVDEEAWVYAACKMNTRSIVTKFMSEINFMASAQLGDIVEIGLDTIKTGNTSLTVTCEVRNKITKERILTVEKIVFVSVDNQGQPCPYQLNPE